MILTVPFQFRVRCNLSVTLCVLWLCVTIGHANSWICIRCFFSPFKKHKKIFQIEVINSTIYFLLHSISIRVERQKKESEKIQCCCLHSSPAPPFWLECTHFFFFPFFKSSYQSTLYSLIIVLYSCGNHGFCLITRKKKK